MADQYRSFQFNGVTSVQYEAFKGFYETFDKSGCDVGLMEYSPITQVLTITFGGQDLSGIRGRFQTLTQARLGRLADAETTPAPGVKVKTARDIRGGS